MSEIVQTFGMIFLKVCTTIFLFIMSFIFGYLPSKLDKFDKNYKIIGIVNSFSGGVFLCIALLHLLPESTELFHLHNESHDEEAKHQEHHHFPMSYFLAFLGYTFILFVEKVMFEQKHTHGNNNHKDHSHSDKRPKVSFSKDLEKIIEETPCSVRKISTPLNSLNASFKKKMGEDDSIDYDQVSLRSSFLSKNQTVDNDNLADVDVEAERNFKKFFSQKTKVATLAVSKLNTESNKQLYSFNKGETDNERFTIKSDVPVLAHMFCSKKNMKTYLLLMALSVHAIFEGIALGIMDEEREIFYMILAIASHKWVEGVSIGISLHNSEINKNLSLVIIFLFSLMTPLGILVGIMLRGISIYFQAILLSFSAGAFLYLSASEVIVEEFSIDINKFEKFYGFGTGIAVITLFTFFEFLH